LNLNFTIVMCAYELILSLLIYYPLQIEFIGSI